MKQFRLPEIGENIEEASVIAVFVKAGNVIGKDEPFVELETEKAAFELPCPFEGKVESIDVSVGDTVKVGGLIATINDGGAEAANTAAEPEPKKKKPEEKAPDKKVAEPAPEADGGAAETREKKPSPKPAGGNQPPSSPSAKSLARDIGIDISQIKGTGARGRVSSEDVRAQAKDLINSPLEKTSELPDFSPWGKTERVPVSTVGKLSARRLSGSWRTVPHVTHHDSADITELEDLRKTFSGKAEKAGGKLTVTAIMVRVVASALGVFTKFNGSFDEQNGEMVLKEYINIGIAVDTERGLVVPVIKNAGEKNIVEISVELADLARRAREKNIKPDDLQGASFTVSNLGGIGGDSFTPIVNFPEVAVLGLSRAKMSPVYDKASGRFKPKLMLPMSLSYDHRMIDGAEAARFSRWVVEAVEEPFKLVFEG